MGRRIYSPWRSRFSVERSNFEAGRSAFAKGRGRGSREKRNGSEERRRRSAGRSIVWKESGAPSIERRDFFMGTEGSSMGRRGTEIAGDSDVLGSANPPSSPRRAGGKQGEDAR